MVVFLENNDDKLIYMKKNIFYIHIIFALSLFFIFSKQVAPIEDVVSVNNLAKNDELVSYYNVEHSSPLFYGKVDNPRNAELSFSFKFSLHAFTSYQNLFQTSNYNNGARLEFLNSKAVLIVRDTSYPEFIKIIPVQFVFKKDIFYDLKLRILNHDSISIQIINLTNLCLKAHLCFIEYYKLLLAEKH